MNTKNTKMAARQTSCWLEDFQCLLSTYQAQTQTELIDKRKQVGTEKKQELERHVQLEAMAAVTIEYGSAS